MGYHASSSAGEPSTSSSSSMSRSQVRCQQHHAAHRPSPVTSTRSPKRVKATPPNRPLSACTSAASNTSCSSASSRLVFDADLGTSHRSRLKSPWRSPAWVGDREPRRKREGTVPMLSQRLSHFSLSHTPPQSETPNKATRPRAPLASFPSFSSSPPSDDRGHRSTSQANQYIAPLPYSHLFLASPFTRRAVQRQETRTGEQAAYHQWQKSMTFDQASSSLESPTALRSCGPLPGPFQARTVSSSSSSSIPSTAYPDESPAFRPRRPPLTMFPKHSRDVLCSQENIGLGFQFDPPHYSAPLPAPGTDDHAMFGVAPLRRIASSVDIDLEAEDFFYHSKPPSSASDSPSLDGSRRGSEESILSAYSSNDDSTSSNPSTLPTCTFILPSPLPLPTFAGHDATTRLAPKKRPGICSPSGSVSEDDCEMLDSDSSHLPPYRGRSKPRAHSDNPHVVAEAFRRDHARPLCTSLTSPAPKASSMVSTPADLPAFSRASSSIASSACKAVPGRSAHSFQRNAFDTPSTPSDSSGNPSIPSPSPMATAQKRIMQSRPASPERKKSVSGAVRTMLPRRSTAGAGYSSFPVAAKQAQPPVKPASQIPRPSFRRGITEPQTSAKAMTPVARAAVHEVYTPFATPPMFTDEKPSPAAFASTGLIKKRGAFKSANSSLLTKTTNKGHSSLTSFNNANIPDTPVKTAMTTPAGLPASRLQMRMVQQESSFGSTDGMTSSGSIASAASSDRHHLGHNRGLRRKGSAMWSGSNSSGSWVGIAAVEPMTPSRHAHGTLVSPGIITTPSPPAPMRIYPFVSRVSKLTQCHPSVHSSPTASFASPTSKDGQGPRNNLLRRIQPRPGPIARASNPLLSAAYKASSVATQGCSGAFASPSLKNSALSEQGRLERDFVILGPLGQGEFSDVLKVKEKKTGGIYAVKRGRPFTGAKDRLRQLQEVAILRQLSLEPNSHILRFVDSWEQQQQLYMRTELADCGDLATFLEAVGDSGGLGEGRVWKMLAELSDALVHVHGSNLIHLDIKPANILITAAGSLKIADFGMSTRTSEQGLAIAVSPALPCEGDGGKFVWGSEPATTVSLEREREGDRAYLAPESLTEGRFGREADIFSLGIMTLEAALNVVLPENGDGWQQLRSDDFSDILEHYNPHHHNSFSLSTDSALPELSETLLNLVKRMMASVAKYRPTIHDVCNHPVVQRARKLMAAVRDDQEWSDTECDEPGPAVNHAKTGTRPAASPALVPEDSSFLALLLRTTSVYQPLM